MPSLWPLNYGTLYSPPPPCLVHIKKRNIWLKNNSLYSLLRTFTFTKTVTKKLSNKFFRTKNFKPNLCLYFAELWVHIFNLSWRNLDNLKPCSILTISFTRNFTCHGWALRAWKSTESINITLPTLINKTIRLLKQ